MSTARRQREAAEAARRRRTQRMVWAATACVVLIVVAATAAIVGVTDRRRTAARAHHLGERPQRAGSSETCCGSHRLPHIHRAGRGRARERPASAARPPTNPDLLKPGTLAPAFTLKTPQGQTVGLSDFRGKPVLLELFATWCPTARPRHHTWPSSRPSCSQRASRSSRSTPTPRTRPASTHSTAISGCRTRRCSTRARRPGRSPSRARRGRSRRSTTCSPTRRST